MNGIIQKGLIIRHLILPNNIENTKQVLKLIKENFQSDIYVSIMAQYFPAGKAKNIQELILVYIRFKINFFSINAFNISYIY